MSEQEFHKVIQEAYNKGMRKGAYTTILTLLTIAWIFSKIYHTTIL